MVTDKFDKKNFFGNESIERRRHIQVIIDEACEELPAWTSEFKKQIDLHLFTNEEIRQNYLSYEPERRYIARKILYNL